MNEPDQWDQIASGLARVADAITANAAGSQDGTGGFVTSMTEATMGITAALVKIAYAIDNIADAIRDHYGKVVVEIDRGER